MTHRNNSLISLSILQLFLAIVSTLMIVAANKMTETQVITAIIGLLLFAANIILAVLQIMNKIINPATKCKSVFLIT
jgi:glycerol uptake facilitator-like aquaporin